MRILFRTGTCSHLAYLIEWVQKSKGPVLEFGIGFGSTPTLHEMCFGRPLVSYENNPNYYEGFRYFRSDTHELNFLEDMSKANLERPWGLAFVDCSPTRYRREAILRLKPWADYILVHDTEPRADRHFKVIELFPTFKYSRTYDSHLPHTTILSDKFPV